MTQTYEMAPHSASLRQEKVLLPNSHGTTHIIEKHEIRSYSRSNWFSNAIQLIESFSALAKGWDGYKAPPPVSLALQVSRDVVEAAWHAGLEPNRISPSAVGGVGFTFIKEEREVYVEVYNRDGRVFAVYEDGNDNSEADIRPIGISTPELVAEFARIAQFLGDQ